MKKMIEFQESVEVLDVQQSPTYAPRNYNKTDDVYIYPRIEAIHAGKTKNNSFFQPMKLKGDPELKSGVFSWTHPYSKPMLTHHNQIDGEPIGRVIEAEYTQNTLAGREGILVKAKISDPEAIEKVLDGRYSTVSIGGETDSAKCSVCGQELTEDWCGHEKGEFYEGQECYWIMGDIWFKELSFVNVPADQNAQVVDLGEVSESISTETDKKPEVVATTDNFDMEEKVSITEFYSFIKSLKDKNISEKEISQGIANLSESEEGGETKLPTDIRLENMTEAEKQEFLSKVPEDLETAKKQKEALLEMNKNISQKYEDIKAEVDQLKQDKESLTNSVNSITEEKDELKKEKDSIEQEKETLENQNAELHSNLHKSLVERVVDMKMYLGKPGIEDRETAIDEHMKRTPESLADNMEDLQAEMDNNETLNAMSTSKVDNSGLAEHDEKNTTKEEPKEPTEGEKGEENNFEKSYTIYKNLFSRRK